MASLDLSLTTNWSGAWSRRLGFGHPWVATSWGRTWLPSGPKANLGSVPGPFVLTPWHQLLRTDWKDIAVCQGYWAASPVHASLGLSTGKLPKVSPVV